MCCMSWFRQTYHEASLCVGTYTAPAPLNYAERGLVYVDAWRQAARMNFKKDDKLILIMYIIFS